MRSSRTEAQASNSAAQHYALRNRIQSNVSAELLRRSKHEEIDAGPWRRACCDVAIRGGCHVHSTTRRRCSLWMSCRLRQAWLTQGGIEHPSGTVRCVRSPASCASKRRDDQRHRLHERVDQHAGQLRPHDVQREHWSWRVRPKRRDEIRRLHRHTDETALRGFMALLTARHQRTSRPKPARHEPRG